MAVNSSVKHAFLANPGTDADIRVGHGQPRLRRHHRTPPGHGCLGRLFHALVAKPGTNDTVMADARTSPGSNPVLANPDIDPGTDIDPLLGQPRLRRHQNHPRLGRPGHTFVANPGPGHARLANPDAGPDDTVLANPGTSIDPGSDPILGQPRLRRDQFADANDTRLGGHGRPILANPHPGAGPGRTCLANPSANDAGLGRRAKSRRDNGLGHPGHTGLAIDTDARPGGVNPGLADPGANDAGPGLGYVCQPRLRRQHGADAQHARLGRPGHPIMADARPGRTRPRADDSGLANPGTDTGPGPGTGTSGVGLPVMADARTSRAGTRTDHQLAAGQSGPATSPGRAHLELPRAHAGHHGTVAAKPDRQCPAGRTGGRLAAPVAAAASDACPGQPDRAGRSPAHT